MLDEQVMQGSNLSSSLSGSTFNPFAVPPETIVQAQQMALEYISRQQPKSLQEAEKENSYINEIQQKAESLARLLQVDKERARTTINELVSSAQTMTSSLVNDLTATPLHPYQKLLHDYLGPNFICPSIKDLTIPQNFSPQICLTELEEFANEVQLLRTDQFARLSAEAMDTSFEGITSENLNNAFAVLSSTAEGERYVINHERLKDHLKFFETVKNIPTDYIIKNPIEVAKKMLAEFTRICQIKI
jgi:hypothetical protein